eukprot:4610154-Amphidinium_carterae.3
MQRKIATHIAFSLLFRLMLSRKEHLCNVFQGQHATNDLCSRHSHSTAPPQEVSKSQALFIAFAPLDSCATACSPTTQKAWPYSNREVGIHKLMVLLNGSMPTPMTVHFSPKAFETILTAFIWPLQHAGSWPSRPPVACTVLVHACQTPCPSEHSNNSYSLNRNFKGNIAYVSKPAISGRDPKKQECYLMQQFLRQCKISIVRSFPPNFPKVCNGIDSDAKG